MNTRFYQYTSLLLAVATLISFDSDAQLKTAADNKSLLWEISGNQLQTPVYLYGTMHLICSEDAVLSPALNDIIKRSDVIYFEMDLDDPVEILSGGQLSIMKNGTHLADLLEKSEYERISNFFNENGFGFQFEAMTQVQPMMLSALVYQTFLKCDGIEGVEMAIMQQARMHRKEVKGLETAAFQASLLDKIPYKKQAADLLFTIDNIEEAEKDAEELQKLYWQQDVDKLLEQSLKLEAGMTEDVQAAIINERNHAWSETIASLAGTKAILFAVGAGHLGGKTGMLQLLKEKGFIIRPIENNRIKVI